MILLDGKKVSLEIQQEMAVEVQKMISDGFKPPHLAAIIVGSDGASETYVASKVKTCEKVGFRSTLITLPSSITEKELLIKVKEINNNNDIDGLIVQLPLPAHISSEKVSQEILYLKDVDGFHPMNVGRMCLNLPAFLPATPFGILQLLERYKVETEGKNCVVMGRSNIVGSPMSILLARNSYPGNCTVTLTHSKTRNLKAITSEADILIAALGKPEFLKADMVKDGAVVVDVGITRIQDSSTKSGYRIAGDVKFDEVSPKCSFITPVPGGVGPMTIAGLMVNTLRAAKISRKS